MANKKKPVRKKGKYVKYPMKFRMEALKILQANEYNYYKTSKEIGVSNTTIRKWHDHWGGVLDREEMTQKIAGAVTKNAAERQEGLLDTYYDLKVMILDRMKEIVKDEKNLDNLQKALKTLCEIDGTLKAGPGEDQSKVVNIYEQINQTLIQQGYESKTPITVDPT